MISILAYHLVLANLGVSYITLILIICKGFVKISVYLRDDSKNLREKRLNNKYFYS